MEPKQLGPYRIERLIGRGGMGAVYEGVDETTGQRVAVKSLVSAFAGDTAFRTRFMSEIETLKKLRHPSIVELIGFGEQEGLLFYSMELVDGVNLEDQMRGGRQFTWREVVKVAIEMCAALRHAHDRGVIHRDIKPANIIEAKDGRVLLSDFGIAKLFGGTELTSAGGVIGTADYMSPEQAAGLPVSQRSDLYSLGAVMYALLAHRPPFVGKSLPEVLQMVRYDAPQPVSRFAFGVPNELEEIIAKLLEKEPDRRIPTALALGNRLKAIDLALGERRKPAPPAPAEGTRNDDSFVLTDGAQPGESGTLPTIVSRPTADVGDEYKLQEEAPAPQPGAKTRQGGQNVAATIATAAEPIDRPQAPQTAAPTRFTTVDKAKLGRPDDAPDTEDQPPWLVWGLAAVVLAGLAGALLFLMRPASAETLLERIDAAAETGALDRADADVASFLERFPDHPRREEVAAYREEMEVSRLERRLELQARRRRLAEPISLVEATYLEAMQSARTNPQGAIQRLEALIAVFDGQSDAPRSTQRCVELAKRQLERLGEWESQLAEQGAKALQERLAQAKALEARDPQAARNIYEGVLELYADQPWAAEAVQAAREARARISAE